MRRSVIAATVLAVLIALGLAFGPERTPRDERGTAALMQRDAPVASQGAESAATVPAAADPEPEATSASAPEPATAQPEDVDDLAALDTLDPVAPETDPAPEEPVTKHDTTPQPDAPRFDLVRATADGQLVIAGETAPGGIVEVLLDGKVIGTAEADRDGTFVAILDTEPSEAPRRLVLRSAAGDQEIAALPDAPSGTGMHDRPASAPVIILPGATEDAAPVLVRSGAETVEVLQPAPPAETEGLALDRITYRPGEDVIAAGRANDARVVRIYANGRLLDELPVDEAGAWKVTIPQALAREADLLRFDEVSASGNVTARLEAPFDYREEGASQTLRKRPLTVERGNNLWRIAESHYGDGLRYSVIFGANSNLIRDPDLIYPGQVFAIPELVEAE